MFSWGSLPERERSCSTATSHDSSSIKIEKNFAIYSTCFYARFALIKTRKNISSRGTQSKPPRSPNNAPIDSSSEISFAFTYSPPPSTSERFIYGMRIKWDIAANINAILFNFFLHIAGRLLVAPCIVWRSADGFFLARSKEKKAHFVVGRDGDDRREDDRVIRDFSPLLAILWFDFRLQNLKALTSCAEELAAWLLHNRGVAFFETLPCSTICIQKKFQCCKAGDFNKVVSLWAYQLFKLWFSEAWWDYQLKSDFACWRPIKTCCRAEFSSHHWSLVLWIQLLRKNAETNFLTS